MSHRGAILSVAAAFFAALFLIPYQAAVVRADRGSVLAAMLLAAAAFNTAAAVREGRRLFAIDRVTVLTTLFLTVTTIAGNTAIALSLPEIGAGMTSVVLKAQVILIPLIAWVVIDERITVHLVAGVIAGVVGFFVMQLGGADIGEAATIPIWALVAALAFAVMQVGTRKVIHRIRPMQVNALRLWLSVAVMLVLPVRLGGGRLDLDGRTWLLAAAAGALGPGISRLCLMFAVRYVTASFTALVSLFGPLFAFVLGYLAFGEVPTPVEVAGALLILAGVAWPVIFDKPD